MLKEATYKEKFVTLKKWMPSIIEAVKKDLRNEHLKQDFLFIKKYFPGKNINKLTTEELVDGYFAAIQSEDNGEDIAEFITNRWLLKNGDIYNYFETELRKINPDFTAIEEIEKPQAKRMVEESTKEFGAEGTYLFSVINSVAFSDEIFKELGQKAEQEAKTAKMQAEESFAKQSVEQMQRSFEQQIARLSDKYEKKLSGLQKKYTQDTEALKKQISALQRKITH